MSVEVRPAIVEPEPSERVRGECEPVRRIRAHDAARRVVAGVVVVAVLDEQHVVSQLREAEHVVEVVPRQTSERAAHDVTENDDAETAHPWQSSSSELSAMPSRSGARRGAACATAIPRLKVSRLPSTVETWSPTMSRSDSWCSARWPTTPMP